MKKFLLIVLIVLLLLVGVGYFFIQSLKPTYSGELTLEGLAAESEVYFDQYGIPHVYAQTEEDAYRALGFVHAQDRLFQMEVVRRIAPGRLSELFGKDMIDTDKFFRTIGIHPYSVAMVKDLHTNGNPAILKMAEAYLSGVNYFVENGPTPIEYTLLGVEKTPFTLVDIYNALGYMGFSFASAQRIEPVLTKIYQELGSEYLEALDLGMNGSTLGIKNFEAQEEHSAISDLAHRALQELPTALWMGSNSWVIAPDKTKSGKVILENDPHVGFAQPAVWYEAHLEAPGFGYYGYQIAGVPFAVFGHSRVAATGLTMFTNDDIDFFQEKLNPEDSSQYEHKGEFRRFETREETLRVKDEADVSMTVRSTIHGPVVNDVLKLKGAPLSMFWTYTKRGVNLLEALYISSHIESIADGEKMADMIHAPGLNVMYGDSSGNVAWWASANMIQRPDSVSGMLINEGWSGDSDPLGFYDFEENPKAINPPWNYVYSANNQTRTTSGSLYPGHYAPEDRARRIVTLLEGQEKFDVDDVKKMAIDHQSENVPEVVASIVSAVENQEGVSNSAQQGLSILSKWNGSFDVAKNAPVIYQKLLYKIMLLGLSDELGTEEFHKLYNSHMIYRSTQTLIANDSSAWWDDVNTEEHTETRTDIFVRALNVSMEELNDQLGSDMDSWRWGAVHTLEHEHPFGKVGFLRKYFNVGPFEVGGSNQVINNLKFNPDSSGVYRVNAGPSTRRIVDYSDVENNSWSILPTGNSGNPFSQHYHDQAQMYANGEFRKQLMNEEEIKSTSPDKLVLRPAEK